MTSRPSQHDRTTDAALSQARGPTDQLGRTIMSVASDAAVPGVSSKRWARAVKRSGSDDSCRTEPTSRRYGQGSA
ncbi:hypothetical protein [Streptomyces sp. NBC_00343]|uniref:hypothetical protein n=1 Tax=Streptomyces sp. NBC_00343 TaxID=2975719 RepID=UPI002E2B52E5|nr:hypothetical protein [Streptomyces sp. NBC_00343]